MNPVTIGGIQGIVYSGQQLPEPPHILIVGGEKSGKSTLATTLMNWPQPGNMPLVLAFDKTGPDSCAQIGYQIPHIKIKDRPGATFAEKCQTTITEIGLAFGRRSPDFPFTSIVCDCASTLTEKLLDEEKQLHPDYKDPRKHYGAVLDHSKAIMWRLLDLQVPVIWLSWDKEPFVAETVNEKTQQKSKRQVMGKPFTAGNFGKILAGKVHQIMILEKLKIGVGVEGADPQGYVRQLHTRTWENYEAGGRFSSLLPEPAPANLGYVLNCVSGIRNGG